MRAVAVHPDALVVTSRLWQLNCVALRAGGEAMLLDSPYFPDELEALPALLASAGFEPDGLLATHADIDHLLARAAFPGLALGVGEPTAMRLRAEPGAAQRELRDHDAELYVARPAPLALGSFQSLPVPGRLDLGNGEAAVELELHPTGGHTADGMAVLAPHCGLLAVGDHVSDVEIPMISPGGAPADYRATLARLAALAERADVVVPGHGAAHGRDAALRLIEEDVLYLDALERGEQRATLPRGRDSAAQRAIHESNLERLG